MRTHDLLYKQTKKMNFLYVFILQFFYNSTCFERPFRSSSGVHDLLYSAALYKPCKRVCNMAHAHCMMGTKSYKQSLRICNIYCFSPATTVILTHLNVMFYVRCLSFCEAILIETDSKTCGDVCICNPYTCE